MTARVPSSSLSPVVMVEVAGLMLSTTQRPYRMRSGLLLSAGGADTRAAVVDLALDAWKRGGGDLVDVTTTIERIATGVLFGWRPSDAAVDWFEREALACAPMMGLGGEA